ncbi:unnamed protein product, partial [marine sediment metagenome]
RNDDDMFEPLDKAHLDILSTIKKVHSIGGGDYSGFNFQLRLVFLAQRVVLPIFHVPQQLITTVTAQSPYFNPAYDSKQPQEAVRELSGLAEQKNLTYSQCHDLSTALMLDGRFDAAYGALLTGFPLAGNDQERAALYFKQGMAVGWLAKSVKDEKKKAKLLRQALQLSKKALYYSPESEVAAAQILALAKLAGNELEKRVAAEYLGVLNPKGAGREVFVGGTVAVVVLR